MYSHMDTCIHTFITFLPALAGEPKIHFSWVMKGANKKFIHKCYLQREDFTGGSCIHNKVSSHLATITGDDCQQWPPAMTDSNDRRRWPSWLGGWKMRSEVRPPPPVEERGPQFHHYQISDIYKMSRSGDRVGLSRLIQVRVGRVWFMLVRVV